MFSVWYAYGGYRDLVKRTTSDKVLQNQTFNIVINSKNDEF